MAYKWITFDIRLDRMSPGFWMRLGEAASKCDHLAHVPMSPQDAEKLHAVTLAKGAHATTAIEGNTLTEDQVRAIVEKQPVASEDYQRREVENVVGAYNEVLRRIRSGDVPELSVELIKWFNREVLGGLELPQRVTPGELRTHSVTVGPYRAPDAQDCAELLAALCVWLNGDSFRDQGPMRIPLAVIKAALVHLYLAWIHPFGDGNGRTARLCEYLVLVTSGVPTSAAHLISNHCNRTRDQYYRELQYASESGGDVTRFLAYCVDGFVQGIGEQLAVLYEADFRLVWRDYVARHVTGRDASMRQRRSLVAESLFGRPPVLKREIAHLSPDLASTYAVCGPRTLARDLNELVSVGLLHMDGERYGAASDLLLSLLPLVVPPTEQGEVNQTV